MSHILQDGQRFSIDASGNTIVRNAAGDEIVKDGTVARMPMIMMDSARKAPPAAAPVFDASAHRPGYRTDASAAATNDAKAKAAHQRMKDRKANSWKHPEPVLDAASDLAPIAPKPAGPGETVRSQDAAWERMKQRKAAAWEKTV